LSAGFHQLLAGRHHTAWRIVDAGDHNTESESLDDRPAQDSFVALLGTSIRRNDLPLSFSMLTLIATGGTIVASDHITVPMIGPRARKDPSPTARSGEAQSAV
jgi:hypothetical protein